MKKHILYKLLVFLLLLNLGIAVSHRVFSEDKKPELLYIKKKFFEEFPYVKPGLMTEEKLQDEFPELIPYDEDGNPDTNALYVLQGELKESGYYYDKVILNFENGLLEWVNLIPKNMSISKYLEYSKTSYEKEDVDENYELYDFSSYILIVDKKTNMVQSIGVFAGELNF